VGRVKAKGSDQKDYLDAMIDALLAEKPIDKYGSVYSVELGDAKTWPRMLMLDRTAQAALVQRILARLGGQTRELDKLLGLRW
jgi:hypothetical protein